MSVCYASVFVMCACALCVRYVSVLVMCALCVGAGVRYVCVSMAEVQSRDEVRVRGNVMRPRSTGMVIPWPALQLRFGHRNIGRHALTNNPADATECVSHVTHSLTTPLTHNTTH